MAVLIRSLLSLAVFAAAAVLWHEGVGPMGHVFFSPYDVYGATVMLGAVGLLSNVLLGFLVVVALIIIWVEQ